MTYQTLDHVDLAMAAALVGLNAVLSLWLSLGLEKRMLVAAGRMVAQLLLIGLVLEALFALKSPWLTGSAAAVMLLFAGREVAARQHRTFAGWWTFGLGGGSMMLAGLVVTLLALTTQIRPDPWYDPRYALPLLGMILGNAMNGISLAFDRLIGGAVRERAAIEARLALGQDRWQALNTVARDAFRSGLMHIVNAMSIAGLVSLPGMMTGQILAGAPPVEAVKYQILIMFLIAGATGLGVVMALTAGMARLTDSRHRLRLDRLSEPRES